MVHNRTPDDEYRKDVEEARRLLALYESMHNGKIREERGEVWYGSREMLDWDRAVTDDMGILLGRVMGYADTVRAERDHYLQAAYKPADPPPSATADVGVIRATVATLYYPLDKAVAFEAAVRDLRSLLAVLAQAEAQRDAAVAALKPLAAVWRGYEEYRAYFDDKHEFWDQPLNILDWLAIDARPETAMPMQTAFQAAADALAQQEGSNEQQA